MSRNSNVQLGRFTGALNFNGRFDEVNGQIVIGFTFALCTFSLGFVGLVTEFMLIHLLSSSNDWHVLLSWPYAQTSFAYALVEAHQKDWG